MGRFGPIAIRKKRNERMIWDSRRLTQLIDVARGRVPAELCLRRCRIVNVLTGRVETSDLAVHRGFIAGWGHYEALETIDAENMFLCPGFIDGHIHLESSLLSPMQFCAAAAPWGTTAVVADPHEMANVLGLDGIRYLLEATDGLPMDVYFNLPSCVPASPLETSGAVLRGSDLFPLLRHPKVLGLAEMMNFPGVLASVPEVIDKLLLFEEQCIDGHSPQLSGLDLNAYLAAGISSDHECTSLQEAREKLSKGMVLMIREGSQSKDLARLLPAVDDHTWPQCLLVSDDRHPDDLLREGHMNAIVNHAMALGLEPVRALTLATWTPARHFRLQRQGAIAPGYQADFTLSPTLTPWVPQRVFKKGREIARNGKILVPGDLFMSHSPPESPMALAPPSPEALAVSPQPGLLRVIEVQEGSLFTRQLFVTPKVEKGQVAVDLDRDILKLVVFNRYRSDCPPSLGFVRGFGLRKGAMATTVAHDSHNLMAVGTNDNDIVHVAETLRRVGGGMAIGSTEEPVAVLPLPIAGLMSDEPAWEVAERLEILKARAASWGCRLHNPLMALSFLALPVIPELKLTDLGLVDVSTFSFVPLFQNQ